MDREATERVYMQVGRIPKDWPDSADMEEESGCA